MKVLSVLCLTLAFVGSQARPAPSKSYLYSAFLDEAMQYQLNWDATDESITFEMIVKTTGYVGLGWSAKGGMKDADIITAWVSDGKGYIQDRYGVGFVKPKRDAVSDVFLQVAKEEDGYTIIKFTRKLDTCDKAHDRPITTSTMRVIWAYGATDPADADGIYYHSTKRGTRSLQLAGLRKKPDPAIPSGAKTFEMRSDNFKIPAVDTKYECKLFEMPKLDKKHHVISREAIITPGNEGVVHHMILYLCSVAFNSKNVTGLLGKSTDCSEMYGDCLRPVFGWAVGGQKVLSFPEHLGFPIGGPSESRYARLEIHYDNPQLRSDIVDSSGFRLTYTTQLRPNDFGVLMVGKLVSRSHIIPPQQEKFISYGFCGEKCLTEALDRIGRDEIRVFGVFPHTHLAGRAVVTRHVRNGVELPPLVEDLAYDFNYQTTRFRDEEAIIRKGDQLITECTYETMDRKKPVFGGGSTRDEMCLSFVFYYPRMSLAHCLSVTTVSTLRALLLKYHTVPALNWTGLTYDKLFDLMTNNMNWKDAAGTFQEMEKKRNYGQVCQATNRTHSYYNPDAKAITIKEPYKPLSPCDLTVSAGNVITTNVLLLTSSILFLILSAMM